MCQHLATLPGDLNIYGFWYPQQVLEAIHVDNQGWLRAFLSQMLTRLYFTKHFILL